MTIKYAIESACPDARLWLDQDERSKSEEGMMAGVEHSQFFVLFLSQSVFARFYCKKEIRLALKLGKRLVLVRETDTRHGAPQALAQPPEVHCTECKAAAGFATAGAAWPTHCAAHKAGGMVETRLDTRCATALQLFSLSHTQPHLSINHTPAVNPTHASSSALPADCLFSRIRMHRSRVSNDILNFSLLLEEKARGRFVADPDALQLAADTLGSPRVVGRAVRWYSELEARGSLPSEKCSMSCGRRRLTRLNASDVVASQL